MSHRRFPRAAVVVYLATLLSAASAHAQIVPTGFTLEQVVGPPFVGEPDAFTWLPDQRILVLERTSGNVRIAPVGVSTSTAILTIPNVSSDTERGLLGVAVDPLWPTRPYVYFSYTRTDDLSVLEMYTASGELTDPTSSNLTLGSPFVVLETPDVSGYHNSGTLRFGLEGRLYMTLGDDGTPCHAQNLTSLNGKVLRLSVAALPEAGGGPPPKADITPPDNPFVGDADENARLVFAWGLRNPFRFTFDPSTGDLFLGEVGASTWEEIDTIPAGSGGGQNFGWPVFEGPDRQAGVTCGENNTFTAPIYYYAHEGGPAAVIGGPLYRSVSDSTTSFPAYYDGSYFCLEWGGQWIRRLVLGPTGWTLAPPVPGQPSPDHWGEGFAYFSDFQEGPDGALYVMKHGGLRALWRIRRSLPTSAAVPGMPVARLLVEARPNPVRAGGNVEFAWEARRPGRVELRVFDAAGRLVTTLESAPDVSRGVLRWSGRDARGVASAAGVYFYRVTQRDARASGTLTLLR